MTLLDYLCMYKDAVDFNVPDDHIDRTVTVSFDKDDEPKDFLDKFSRQLYSKVEITYLINGGIPVCNFTRLIQKHKDKFLEFAKEYWESDYYEYVRDDEDNLADEFIKEFDNVVGGRYGEHMNKAYWALLLSL